MCVASCTCFSLLGLGLFPGGCVLYIRLSSLTIVAICAQPLPLPPFPCCLLIPFVCRAFICVCRLWGGARPMEPPTSPMLAYVIRLLVQSTILYLPLLLNCCLMHLLATLVLYAFFVFFRRSSVGWHMPVCLQSARACLLFFCFSCLSRPFYFGFSSLAYLQHGGPILLVIYFVLSLSAFIVFYYLSS